ncbi:hypothetical protein GCK32_013919, partial [Trichostrongylus colubriformis]
SSRRVVCVYSMVEVDKRFDHDWTICQKTTLRSGGQDCESAAKEEYLQDHCHIFTRRTDAFRMQTCTRFGQDVQRVYENCNLHEYFGRSYRYGWLEDFRPFNGISVANVDTDLENIISVIPDELHGALFLAGYGRGSTILLRVPWSLEQQTSLSPILWSGESFPQSRFSISLDKSGDAVFILNGTVDSRKPECDSMLKDYCPLLCGACRPIKKKFDKKAKEISTARTPLTFADLLKSTGVMPNKASQGRDAATKSPKKPSDHPFTANNFVQEEDVTRSSFHRSPPKTEKKNADHRESTGNRSDGDEDGDRSSLNPYIDIASGGTFE